MIIEMGGKSFKTDLIECSRCDEPNEECVKCMEETFKEFMIEHGQAKLYNEILEANQKENEEETNI